MVKEKIKQREGSSDDSAELKKLVLHNDDVNHFEFVIQSLIDVCDHFPEQAEQCALIAHYKGHCEIKDGTFKELMSYHKELTIRNLTVSIE
jgi:ATP-dependent Clp protease adaptor protein ClpS